MKYITAITIAAILTGCGSDSATPITDEPANNTTEQSTSSTTSSTTTLDVNSLDPQARYIQFADTFDDLWGQTNPDPNDSTLANLVTESYGETVAQSIRDSIENDYVYEIPDRSAAEDTKFGQVEIDGFVIEDAQGEPDYNEGQTASFKICRTDKTIKKSTSGETIDDTVITYETQIEMQFDGGEWKVNGRQTINKLQGEQTCNPTN